MNCMKENDADVVYVDIQYFGFKNFINKKSPFYVNNILYQNPCSVTSLYKKNIWEEIGGYSLNMAEGYEDWEFWINTFKHGFKFQYLSKLLLKYRTNEVSRDINAKEKDTYLKSKIILIHPELYTVPQVQKAIKLIKEMEGLDNDLYFYYPEELSIDTVSLSKDIIRYLTTNKLEERQFIPTSSTDKIIGLYNLDLVQSGNSIQKLYKETNVDIILFYASVRYKVPFLKSTVFAWNKNKGIIDIRGTIFSFVPKLDRECSEKQLVAYQRLNQYRTDILEPQIQKQISNYRETIKNRDETIKHKNIALTNKDETIKHKNIALQKD